MTPDPADLLSVFKALLCNFKQLVEKLQFYSVSYKNKRAAASGEDIMQRFVKNIFIQLRSRSNM